MSIYLNIHHRLGQLLPQRIVIVRSLPGLGDWLCAIPALRALRIALPNAEITLIGLRQVIPWLPRFQSYVDRWLEFPGYPGIPEVPFSAGHTVAFLSQMQSNPADLALQLHGNGSCINSFTLLLGATHSAGFFPNGQCPNAEWFLPYPERESEIWRHLRLMEFLGIPLQGDQLEFPLQSSDWNEWAALVATYPGLNSPFVCIHPGASTVDRRWSVAAFAQVADTLAAQGQQIVLTGTDAEHTLTQAVAEAMHFPSINLSGKTNLGTLAVLLKRSRGLICNDTGISHMAAALQVNSIVIFTNSDPQRWAPLDRQRHRIVIATQTNVQEEIDRVLTEVQRWEAAYVIALT
jgi:ADP-heptose:LPS heptosyltransferase